MASKIQIFRDGKAYGPYSLEDVRKHMGSGRLKGSDRARYEGEPIWIQLSQLPGVQDDRSVTPEAITGPVAYASHWARFAALLVDLVVNGILILLFLIIGWIVEIHILQISSRSVHGYYWSLIILLSLWLVVLTEAILTSSSWAGTVGKRVLKLRVTDYQGGRLKFWRSIGRSYLKWSLFWIVLLFSPIFELLTRKPSKKQGLHDKMVETLVQK